MSILIQIVCRLMIQVRQQEINHTQLLAASKQAKFQLEELVPEASNRRETESKFRCLFFEKFFFNKCKT